MERLFYFDPKLVMKLALVDLNWRRNLPLTFGKSTAHLLLGIDSINDKWARLADASVSHIVPSYLSKVCPFDERVEFLVNASAIPSDELISEIKELNSGEVLSYRGKFVASRFSGQDIDGIRDKIFNGEECSVRLFGEQEKFFNQNLFLIEKPSDIFSSNDVILRKDFEEITEGIHTTAFEHGVWAKGQDIFIHPSAKVSQCSLNAETGPIYIGENAEIMEGCLIRGPFSIGKSSALKMGAKVYGATSIGEHCKVGGEVNNLVINSYSNKGHDGFVGNSVIGSWCNLGADTNTSNLKNNYGEVSVWNYSDEAISPTGLQFHGSIIGDHSKIGINTMLNTGTVIGMCSNIFGSNFPKKFIPSFSWGSPDNGFSEFRLEKAFEASQAMMKRRDLNLSEDQKEVFTFVLEHDKKYR